MTRQPAAHSAREADSQARGLLLQRKCACGNHTHGGGECSSCSKRRGRSSATSDEESIQTKLTVNQPGDDYEQEAERVASRVMRSRERLPGPISRIGSSVMRRSPAGTEDCGAASVIESRVGALAGSGEPLNTSLRGMFEPRFGHDFGAVRVHTGAPAADMARAVRADAFTLGPHVVFGAGQYSPGTADGQSLLAHELTHVVQQGHAASIDSPVAAGSPTAATPTIQRANPADPRLPLHQIEAVARAVTAKAAIDAANVSLGAAADPRRRNVPAFVLQQGITLAALTPRHDSAAPVGRIDFFAGEVDYAASVQLPDGATHHVDAGRTSVRVRARNHANVDNLLPAAEIEDRLVQAVSEVAYTASAAAAAPNQFDLYRAEFNALWPLATFAILSSRFDPGLNSKGPRTTRARAIFDQIYAENVPLKTAYDANTGGIRTRIDTYSGPEGFNPINSPRLQSLRNVFFPVAAPVPAAAFVAFRAGIQAAANALEPADRDVVDSSNEWQELINRYVTSDAQRAEIRTIIRTPPPAPPPPPVAPPPPAPAPAPVGGGVTAQQFVDGIRIDGPAAPVVANNRRETVTLTPRSNVANPNVAIDSRLTVTPANRVQGVNVSPASPWLNGSPDGTVFAPDIINTATIAMNAHLDLSNGPVGLAPAAPVPDLPFTVQDNREANFVANWFAAVNFNTGGFQDWFVPGTSHPRYQGGSQTFNAGAFLPGGGSNPGLTLFVKARIKRGAAVIKAPPTLEAFPPDSDRATQIPLNIQMPAVVPVGGDDLDFEVELIAADRVTVLNTKVIAINVGPDVVYTKAQAIAEATADNAHFHDNSATGLLGKMTAMGGAAASVAAAVNAAPPAPRLTLKPLTVRHDSAAYVTAVSGGPNPSLVGYFVGTSYNAAPPDNAHSFSGVAGAAAFFIPSGFGPRFVVSNRTTDVAAKTKRTDAELIPLIIHEAVHAMDVRPGAGTPIEAYKTEFRAYWMDARFGPPDQGGCPPPLAPLAGPCAPAGCQDTSYFPTCLHQVRNRAAPGRSSVGCCTGSTTSPCVKPSYDNNIGFTQNAAGACVKVPGTTGYREAVDNYIIPDGINLIVSVRLESLRKIIASFSGAGFAAFRTKVQAFKGVGAAPAIGVLSADERNEVERNRAWRDLVESKVLDPAKRAQIKGDLGIPV